MRAAIVGFKGDSYRLGDKAGSSRATDASFYSFRLSVVGSLVDVGL